MNTGQTMLTIGAFILLAVIILRVNNSFLSTDTVVQESKFGVLAVSIGSSIIEEANRKAFDQATVGNAVNSLNLLTQASKLGPENGEKYSSFNDFDDFNGYDTTITNLPSATFNARCVVCYVDPSNPDVAVNTQTWNKKITVYVTSPSSTDTMRLSSIFSYFYFR
jgi:hypothetical protein